MARGRKARKWVKMDCDGLLHGSICYLLELDGQAVWFKMIAFSEVSGGRPGYIEDNNQRGLPHKFISHRLGCDLEVFEQVYRIMTDDGALETDENGSIHLVNFDKYQFTEYDRQRPYRQASKANNNGDGDRDYHGQKFDHMVKRK